MTPDSIAPDPRDSEETDDAPESTTEPAHRVRVYDGLVVDPMGDAGTIGADANGGLTMTPDEPVPPIPLPQGEEANEVSGTDEDADDGIGR